MDALRSLLDNEKGLVAVALIIAATALTITHSMTIDQWQNFATWVFGIYAGSTALHGAAQAFADAKAATPPPAPAAAASITVAGGKS